jgi:hypothetical protein
MPADPAMIRIERVPELNAAIDRFGSDCKRFLRVELKTTSDLVRGMAVFEAHAKGLDDTGRLIASLRAGATAKSGFVRDTARNQRDAYSYPSRYEYEAGGRRAFIHPVIDQAHDVIVAHLEGAIETAVERFNHQGGL